MLLSNSLGQLGRVSVAELKCPKFAWFQKYFSALKEFFDCIF